MAKTQEMAEKLSSTSKCSITRGQLWFVTLQGCLHFIGIRKSQNQGPQHLWCGPPTVQQRATAYSWRLFSH